MLVVAVAGGVGCSLASAINEKMSKDRTYVNVIMSDDLEEMKRLRDFSCTAPHYECCKRQLHP